VTAVARFRLFGRPTAGPARPAPHGAAPRGWAPPGSVPPGSAPPGSAPPGSAPRGSARPGPGWGVAPPVGAGAPWPGPATRSARPAGADLDPPTDPHGFPPVPADGYWSGPTPARTPDPAEASALAGAFAVDYLSWDEDDPTRRGRVLLDYLSSAGSDPARLGWSGVGRQRAEFALPGLVHPDGDGRVLVDVRVRVTPYRSVGDHTSETPDPAEPDPPVAGSPAAAPAPTGRGWRSLASCWIRLSVPVTFNGSRLVVDAWEETLGEHAPPPALPVPRPHEHALADDDPLVEPGARGGR